jgi:hypothetical protein
VGYKHLLLVRLVSFVACPFIFLDVWSIDAAAAPEEIEVYLDEFEAVGKADLETHFSYVASGQQPTSHQFRATPELSYGINTNWEVGAYWLTVKSPGESPQTDGMKIRARWRPEVPAADSLFYWAVNFEYGQLSRRFYQDEASGEIKLIGVWRSEPWTLGINLNFDRAVKTRPVQAASTEVDTKLEYKMREGLQIGIESYSFLGANHYDPSQPLGSNATYLVSDFNIGKWDLNVGIGHVSRQSPDKTILKAIIGMPL